MIPVALTLYHVGVGIVAIAVVYGFPSDPFHTSGGLLVVAVIVFTELATSLLACVGMCGPLGAALIAGAVISRLHATATAIDTQATTPASA